MSHTPGPWKTGPINYADVYGPDMLVALVIKGHAESVDNARLIAAAPEQHAALNAVLLFHSASPWDEQKREAWRAITGTDESTTKVLCDHIRSVLGKVEVPATTSEAEQDRRAS